MKRPEKVAGHDVNDDAHQHQKNRHPENPTVVHSPPARSVRMTVMMLVTMVLIVHTKERKHITGTSVLGKEKVRAGPARFICVRRIHQPRPRALRAQSHFRRDVLLHRLRGD